MTVEADTLLAELKTMLRERGVVYAELADALGVSLLTVKRMLNKSSAPLDRLLEVCRVAGLDAAELFARASGETPRHTIFDDLQDALFDRLPETLTYLQQLIEGRSPEQIAAAAGLTAASTGRYLRLLESAALLRLEDGEVRLLVRPPIGFGPGSRVLRRQAAAFLSRVSSRVVEGEGDPKRDVSLLKDLRLTPRQFRDLRADLIELVDRYSFLSERPGGDAERPHWQLAIAASRDAPPDEDAPIRNLRPDEADVGERSP